MAEARTQSTFGGTHSTIATGTPTLTPLYARFRRTRGDGERALTCTGILFIILEFYEDNVLLETHEAQGVVACVIALIPELFQTFPGLTLALENTETL